MFGCVTPSPEYDYDKEYDFSTLKAYEWMDAPQYVLADPFVTERAKSALIRELDAKGIQRALDNPDFLIRVSNWFVRPRYDMDYEGSEGAVAHPRIVLHIDFVEAKTKQVVWQAERYRITELNRIYTPQDKEPVINELVIEMIKHFPPDQKK